VNIGVVGGGTAGYFAALAVKRRFPAFDVTLVESRDVPIIGVGEATTTLMPPFLHRRLGIDPVELFAAVKPTFKLGIKFEWGRGFHYPFGDADPAAALRFDGDMATQSLVSLLMAADRAPVLRGPGGELVSLLGRLPFAYHLDNAPFVAFLAAQAARAGIGRVEMTIEEVRLDERGVAGLRSRDRELSFDLYVDASGFRSLLLERLGTPFLSYAGSLFCDRAVTGTVPASDQPYTTAETMDAGWCWRIPVEGEDHRGYVHASAFADEDAAAAEMGRKNPGLRDLKVVRFRSGRHTEMWQKNVVALGNAYGFVEPLESTALHMVIVGVSHLLDGLADLNSRATIAAANRDFGAAWDELRWFLSIHYKFNRRLETTFWRAARADVDVSGMAERIERFRREGPWPMEGGGAFNGVPTLLLGQEVPGGEPRSSIDPDRWRARVADDRRLIQHALPQSEALAILAAHPKLLRELVDSPRSWLGQ
jgi:tryptophan halogenase